MASEAKNIGTTSLRISSLFARDKNHAVAASSRFKKLIRFVYHKRLILFFMKLHMSLQTLRCSKKCRTESSPPEAATAHGLPDRPADARETLLSDKYLPKVCYRYAQSCFMWKHIIQIARMQDNAAPDVLMDESMDDAISRLRVNAFYSLLSSRFLDSITVASQKTVFSMHSRLSQHVVPGEQ